VNQLRPAALVLISLLLLGFVASVACGQVAAGSSVTATINVTDQDLSESPVAANWPSYNGDYTGRRYSRLDQITPANVSKGNQ